MSEGRTSFVQRALDGYFLDCAEAVDDEIAAWHEAETSQELHEWLGMTCAEYELLVERPDALGLILQAHRFGLDALALVEGECDQSLALAARGGQSKELADVAEWLRRTGRLSN